MGEKMEIAGIGVGTFVGVIALVFVLGAVGLGYKMIFKPAHENVDRKVFENTQSYVHGKIQDLAKYKAEYDAKADDPNGQQAIRIIIQQQFAQFDSNKVVDTNLRQFLVSMRGF